MKKRILIIEDSAIISSSLKEIIESYNYEVCGIFTTGEEVIEKIPVFNPDIVIMDIFLGGEINGVDTAIEIKKMIDVPIIYITGHSDEILFEKALSTEPYGYLTKPVNSINVYFNIRSAFERFEMKKKIQEIDVKYKNLFNNTLEPMIVTDMNRLIIDCNQAFLSKFGYSREEILNKEQHLLYKDINNYARIDEFQKTPDGETSLTVNNSFKKKSGDIFIGEVNIFKLKDTNENITEFISYIRDITDRLHKYEELDNMYQIISGIIDNVPLGIAWINEKGIINNSYGIIFDKMKFEGGNITGLNIEKLFTNEKEKIQKTYKGEATDFIYESRYNENQSYYQVNLIPDRVKGKGIIAIFIDVTEIMEKRNLEKEILAISNKERQKIASELHDDLGQILAGIAYLVEAFNEKLTDNRPVNKDEINSISGLINRAIKLTKNISKGLSPVQIKDGLYQALVNLTKETGSIYKIECTLDTHLTHSINNLQIETHLYYIASEAINNAVKHGKADIIKLYLEIDSSGYLMKIIDNGKAKKTKKISHGLGIALMKYRATQIGANIELQKSKRGFTVTVYKSS